MACSSDNDVLVWEYGGLLVVLDTIHRTVSASNEIREATNQSTNPINHHASHIIIPMRTISVGRSDVTHVDSTFTCTI